MENQLIKKIYKISRIILAIIVFIVSIAYDNIIISLFWTLIMYGISFPSSLISKKIMNLADKIENRFIKILFYIFVMPIIIILFFLLVFLILFFYKFPNPNEIPAAFSHVLLGLFFITFGFICIIVPYIQTLIVLILKKFIKN